MLKLHEIAQFFRQLVCSHNALTLSTVGRAHQSHGGAEVLVEVRCECGWIGIQYLDITPSLTRQKERR